MCEVAGLIVQMSAACLLGSGPRTVRTAVHSGAAKGVWFRACESLDRYSNRSLLLHLVRGATSSAPTGGFRIFGSFGRVVMISSALAVVSAPIPML